MIRRRIQQTTQRPRSRRWIGMLLSALIALGAIAPRNASAAPHEVRLPLHNGEIHLGDLSATICREMHLPAWNLGDGAINLNGIRGSLFISSLNAALGEGCQLTVSDDALVLRFDPAALPHTTEQARQAVRTFVATDNPQATALQAKRWGLFLPTRVDATRPLVILIHGLNAGTGMLRPMGDCLESRGCQVAYFGYPSDQAIHDDALFLEKDLDGLREEFPGIRIDLVAHSMGGLVARAYVEGPRYKNDVDHLILVGTPNYGSHWASVQILQELGLQYSGWQNDPEWHLSWMFTEGMGEAARDLKPRSHFLRALDKRPRREHVQYTVIAGSRSHVTEIEAAAIAKIAMIIPRSASDWPVLGDWRRSLLQRADKLREATGDSDGPVSIHSARLQGVKDLVILPADHMSLFLPDVHGNPPAAFETICDRLGK